MRRADLLALIRVAGYHEDGRQFARLVIENRISKSAAGVAYAKGQAQRLGGMACACPGCAKS